MQISKLHQVLSRSEICARLRRGTIHLDKGHANNSASEASSRESERQEVVLRCGYFSVQCDQESKVLFVRIAKSNSISGATRQQLSIYHDGHDGKSPKTNSNQSGTCPMCELTQASHCPLVDVPARRALIHPIIYPFDGHRRAMKTSRWKQVPYLFYDDHMRKSIELQLCVREMSRCSAISRIAGLS